MVIIIDNNEPGIDQIRQSILASLEKAREDGIVVQIPGKVYPVSVTAALIHDPRKNEGVREL